MSTPGVSVVTNDISYFIISLKVYGHNLGLMLSYPKKGMVYTVSISDGQMSIHVAIIMPIL